MAQPATPDVSSAAKCGGAAPAAAFGTTDYTPLALATLPRARSLCGGMQAADLALGLEDKPIIVNVRDGATV